MCSNKCRTVYLVRHGTPEFADGIHRCIGSTDIPLSEEGRKQAATLYQYFQKYPVTAVYSSPLRRSKETARILAGDHYPVQIQSDLRELDMGEWENVPLQKLKTGYRKELESEPEHGEKRTVALVRFQMALEEILRQSEGDIVCVAHAGVNCCYLSKLLGKPLEKSRELPQPYGGISVIAINKTGGKIVEKCGIMPEKAPNIEKCQKIWMHYQTPDQVIAHCKAVCDRALQIGQTLNQLECGLDLELLRGAALLHDVARVHLHHTEEGARILRREGYPEVADIILRHHDLQEPKDENAEEIRPTEAEVVYLSDKLTEGTLSVTLEERFAVSGNRCKYQSDATAAIEVHAKRYEEAKRVENKIKRYIDYHRNNIPTEKEVGL